MYQGFRVSGVVTCQVPESSSPPRLRAALRFRNMHRTCEWRGGGGRGCHWLPSSSDISVLISPSGVMTFPRRIPSRAPTTCRSTYPTCRRKSSFSIAFICTKRRQIPALAIANDGPGKGDLVTWSRTPSRRAMTKTSARASPARHQSRVSKPFCKSQFPHKPVNLFCILVMKKDKLTDL